MRALRSTILLALLLAGSFVGAETLSVAPAVEGLRFGAAPQPGDARVSFVVEARGDLAVRAVFFSVFGLQLSEEVGTLEQSGVVRRDLSGELERIESLGGMFMARRRFHQVGPRLGGGQAAAGTPVRATAGSIVLLATWTPQTA